MKARNCLLSINSVYKTENTQARNKSNKTFVSL